MWGDPTRTHAFGLRLVGLGTSKDSLGETWTRPVVIARRRAGGLSYPYLFEPNLGELRVTTRFSFQIPLSLRENEFLRP